MHEEAKRVDQPAQDKMIASQQVEGHLRPEKERIKLRDTVEKKSCVLIFLEFALKRLTYHNF